MKGVNNLKIGNKLFSLLLAGSIAVTMSGCGKVEMSSVTAQDLLAMEPVRSVTQVDELLGDGQLRYNGELNIIQAADRLERYMDIVDQLKDCNFDGVDELRKLSEEEYLSVIDYSKEEIEELKKKSNSKDKDLKSIEERLVALKKLNFLNDYCKSWVLENGKSVSEQFMLATVKASVADEVGVDYKNVVIPPRLSNDPNAPDDYTVKVNDEFYVVPVSSEEIWNTINYLYRVQSSTLTNETRYETFRKAINFGKTTLAAGCNLKNNKIEEQFSASYIKGNFLK